MMHLRVNRGAVADLSDFAGSVSSRERGFKSLTRIVVALSIILAIFMIAF